MPPFRLRTKSIAVGTPAAAEDPRVVAGAGDELGRARQRPRAARRAAHRSSRPGRCGGAARSRSRATSASSCSGRRRPGVDDDGHPRRNDVDRVRLDLDAGRRSRPSPSRRPMPRRAERTRPPRASASSRASIGVVPAWSARPSKTTSPRACPTIAVTIPSGSPEPASTGPCSMCSSRNAAGSARPRRRRCSRRSPRLLVAEDDDAELGVGQRRSAASIAATTPSAPSKRPAVGNAVEVRAAPDARLARAGRAGCPASSTVDLEPGLAQPPRREARAPRPPRPSRRPGAAPMA